MPVSSLCLRKTNLKGSAVYGLLILCAVPTLVCGCSPSYENSGTEPVVSSADAVSDAVDSPAKKQAQLFVQAVQSADYKKAFSLLSPEMQSKTSLPELTRMIKEGPLKPLGAATDVKFQPSAVSGKGKRATQRLLFDSGGQKNYRMNIVQGKFGDVWLITTLVPPVKYEPPASSSGATSAGQ